MFLQLFGLYFSLAAVAIISSITTIVLAIQCQVNDKHQV